MLENPETSTLNSKCTNQAFEDNILSSCDFADLIVRFGDMYVDKSLWIKEVIESKERIQLHTRPQKMGKSINITMLKRFLSNLEHN